MVLRKVRWLALLTAFALWGCGKTQRPPQGILSHAEMVEALCEVYITEEKVNKLVLKRDSARVVFEYFEGRMFDKMGLSDSVFRKSYEYYKSRPNELEQIYAVVVDTLSLREHSAPIRFKTQ